MANESSTAECVSPEAGLASIEFRYVSLVHICLTVSAIVTGAVWRYKHRKKVYLSRRSPALVALLVIPVLANMTSASLYRWFLNQETIFSSCFLGNFTYALVVPTLMIPMSVRMMSFHHKAKLNKQMSMLGESSEVSSKKGSSFYRARDNPLSLARANTVFTEDTYGFSHGITDYRILQQINKCKRRSSSFYAFKVAMGLIVFAIICAVLYGMFTCPFPSLNLTTCRYAFIATPAVAFVVVPVLIPTAVYIYFRRLIRRIPDPFKIKREIDLFAYLCGAAALTVLFSTFEVGGFSDPDNEEEIMFKWETILDYLLLLMFLNSVHFQIYKATRSSDQMLNAVPFTLEQVLRNSDGEKLFEIFLQNDFSVENLKIYQILCKWKRSFDKNGKNDSSRRDNEARNIFRRWLDTKNEEAVGVNVPYRMIETVREKVTSGESNYPSTLFDEIIEEVFVLMARDSFIRFVNTDEYKEFVGVQDPVLLEDEFWEEVSHRNKCCSRCSPYKKKRVRISSVEDTDQDQDTNLEL